MRTPANGSTAIYGQTAYPRKTSKPSPSGEARLTFAKKGLHQLREAIRGAGIAAENFVWPPPATRSGAVPGLGAVRGTRCRVFFGRDAENLRALDKLRGMRTPASTASS